MLNDALEVRQRTKAVNDKITYAAEAQSVLRQLLTEVGIQSFPTLLVQTGATVFITFYGTCYHLTHCGGSCHRT